MNNLKNQVRLTGNIGALPILKTFDNGQTCIRFSLATNEYYKTKAGEKKTETQWHSIVAWGKTAEIASKLLDKGKEVMLEGKLTSRNYEDKNGEKKYITEVVMNEFLLLDRKAA